MVFPQSPMQSLDRPVIPLLFSYDKRRLQSVLLRTAASRTPKSLRDCNARSCSLNHFIKLSIAEKIARLEVLSLDPSARGNLASSPVESPRAVPLPIVRNGGTVDQRYAARDSQDPHGRIVAELTQKSHVSGKLVRCCATARSSKNLTGRLQTSQTE